MYRFIVELLQPFLLLHLLTVFSLVYLWCRAKEFRGRVLIASIAFALLFLAKGNRPVLFQNTFDFHFRSSVNFFRRDLLQTALFSQQR